MALSVVATLLLAACGGPSLTTPTALPAGLVRPVQPTPAYPASAQEFTLTAAAPSTTPSPAGDLQPLPENSALTAASPAVASARPAAAPVMDQPPTALGIVTGGPASLLQQPGGVTLTTLPVGTTLTITGRAADGRSLAVFTSAGAIGWVAADAVALFGASDLTTLAAPADLGPVATLIAQAMEPVDQQVRRFAAAPAMAGAPPPAAGSPTGVVAGDARLNVRAAPDRVAAVIGQLLPGDTVAITGRTADGSWLRVALGGGEGWVSAQYVELSVPLELVPPAQPGS